MTKESKIINKKTVSIFTIVLYILMICIFEIGYCNCEFFLNRTTYYFSLIRIISYIIGLIVICAAKNKFINDMLKTIDNKFKRILIYISTLASFIVFIAYCIIAAKNPEIIRTTSICMLAVFMANLFIIYVSNNVTKNVILTLFTFGLIFSITTNFNHTVDEKRHFMSAFNVANFNFDYINKPITDKKIDQMPHLLDFNSINEFIKDKYVPEITSDVNMEDVPSTPAPYPFISYLFPAIGIFIAKVLGGSIIDMYILGRIFNLILYAILISIAIKLMPFKKNIFAVIFCMPYAILLSASYSVDGFCIGVVTIFIAYCLKIYKEGKTITLKNFIILFGLFLLMLTAKSMSYIFVAAIVFILPIVKTIKNNKKYIPIYIVVGIILSICIVMLALYVKNTQVTSDTRSANTNVEEQLKLLLTNPKHDLILAFNQIEDTLLNYNWYAILHPDVFFTRHSSYVMFAMLLFILYVSLTEDDYNFKIKHKAIMCISYLLVFAMTSAVLYISFTAVGEVHVSGYQTRYILPVLPLLLFCLSSNKIKVDKGKNRNMNISLMSALFVLIGLAQVIVV